MLRPKDLCQGSGTKTFLDAMHSGKLHLARFVLDALDGRIINSKTESGRTPLMFAASLQESAGRSKFIQMLLEKGADVNARDEQGRTALSLACELGHLDVVKLLVQFNADPEIMDTWGNSALMYAAFAGHNQVLEFLVRAFKRLGLQLDHTNRAGHSAIQVADYFGHSQCVQALNGPGKKEVGLSLGNSWKDQDGESQHPNKLPKQILERFSKPFHSKNEESLPALFQRQVCVGDTRFKRQPPSPERMTNGQCPSKNNFGEEDENTLFNTKQIQNSMLRDTRVRKTIDFSPEKGTRHDIGGRQEVNGHVPLWGKAKSFNLELLTGRKQSYQGDVQDLRHSARQFKRASLQDEKTLMKIDYLEKIHRTRQLANNKDNPIKLAPLSNGTSHFQEENSSDDESKTVGGKGGCFLVRRDALKRGSIPQVARQNKLLLHREEIQPEKITVRPPGYPGLGTRLLRRFTAPEFMKFVRDCPLGNGKGKIARSETFPLTHTHQRVSSQPSVDSISGVRCEFEGSPRCMSNNNAN
ncbi:poly [ADP-ribose] polymerase tankyrase-2 [Alosa sapidissima]|uniref:poly [ADP-ribose] polymerase tankyrase-2 n=1 Tax=Alosa sapidissima TaxID=34773 RepID=UPI001C09F0DC|nr:poly [ADP-ribose] polymerase tankyrase-2 [Alosa sapidissima]